MVNFSLHPVHEEHVDALIRHCEWPAMKHDPLQRIMFPNLTPDSAEEEECIEWKKYGLLRTIQEKKSVLYQVYIDDETPVGFAGWRLENSTSVQDDVRQLPRVHREVPKAIDVDAWMIASGKLQAEKRRVIGSCTDVWRVFTLAVSPEYQRQGVGSKLMQWGCDFADAKGYKSFVMASPAGLRVYKKFGFEVVGVLETSKGIYHSMVRAPQ